MTSDILFANSPFKVIVVFEPSQTGLVCKLLSVAKGLTITVMVAVFEHVESLMSVPVIVYVVVLEGFAVTVAPVVEDRPVEGLHV